MAFSVWARVASWLHSRSPTTVSGSSLTLGVDPCNRRPARLLVARKPLIRNADESLSCTYPGFQRTPDSFMDIPVLVADVSHPIHLFIRIP
ncbi:hypothetical protein BS17DRAFT_759802, partial [Gyrodon lividus]